MSRLRLFKELQGMDLDEDGIWAYPEYVISALAAPMGMPRDAVGYLPSPNGKWRAGSVMAEK